MNNKSAKERLMSNWGEIADSMDCFVELKYVDMLTNWACYIYALDPMDEDTVQCIFGIGNSHSEPCLRKLSEIDKMYNMNGEGPILDKEFRRTHLSKILERYPDDL